MVQALTAEQAHELISRGEVDVIDVRDPAEWLGGHIEGARLVPLAQLQASPKSALRQDRVVFVCAAGVRSQTAARVAVNHGFKTVYSLNGGTRGWVKAGFQLVNEVSVAV
jgi:rhodanese-related sulfurtransferase